MIRELIRESWRTSPAKTLLAIPAAILVVAYGWALLVVVLGAQP